MGESCPREWGRVEAGAGVSRLAIYGIAAVVVLALVLGYGHTRYKAGERAAEARMQGRVDEANVRAAETETASQDRIDKKEKESETKLADLNTRYADVAARYERLRKQSASRSQLPQTAANACPGDASPDRPGHAGADDPDHREVLALYGRDAAELQIALKTCQSFGAELERFRASVSAPP